MSVTVKNVPRYKAEVAQQAKLLGLENEPEVAIT
jgi:hypothetical protein